MSIVRVPDMRLVPGGSVELHDARRARRWTVRLDEFFIATTPVCDDEGAPLAGVSWVDAVAICNDFSAREGLAPAYRIDGEGVAWDARSPGYRLPTEAEWEYACRAGTTGPHYGDLTDIAWTFADGFDRPQPAGRKAPNGWGLYDTLGNVWEWCWDYLDPARYGDYRVFRGGGFADAAWGVRASVRRGGPPGSVQEDLGLRLARGGFTDRPVVQGWSAAADRERAAISGARPVGWTSLE